MNKLDSSIFSTFLFFEVVCILKHPQFGLHLNFLLIQDILIEKKKSNNKKTIYNPSGHGEWAKKTANHDISHSTLMQFHCSLLDVKSHLRFQLYRTTMTLSTDETSNMSLSNSLFAFKANYHVITIVRSKLTRSISSSSIPLRSSSPFSASTSDGEKHRLFMNIEYFIGRHQKSE